MTIELRAMPGAVFKRMVSLALILPAGGLVLYPFYYLSLPAGWQALADLPQDLLLILIGEAVALPAVLLALYARERRWRWRLSATGVEVIRNGVRERTLAWTEIASLDVRGDTVRLRTQGKGSALRIRFVDRAAATAAARAWRGDSPPAR